MTRFNFQLSECLSSHTSEADRTSCEPIATIQNLENRDNYRNGIFTSPDQVLVNRCSGKEVHVFYTVTRKLPVNSNGRMERLMFNFHLTGYYCSPKLSSHQSP